MALMWCILWQKRSHFYNFPAAFLNITPKPDMLHISFLAQTFQTLCLRKRINFTSTFYESISYNTLKLHKKHTHTGLIILILKRQKSFLRCIAALFISRLIYNIFMFNY